jgi:hypothetical protein
MKLESFNKLRNQLINFSKANSLKLKFSKLELKSGPTISPIPR